MAPDEFDMTDHLKRQVKDFEDVDEAARALITAIDYPPYGPWLSEECDPEHGAATVKELVDSTEVTDHREALAKTAP
jgi:hypothetical protein